MDVSGFCLACFGILQAQFSFANRRACDGASTIFQASTPGLCDLGRAGEAERNVPVENCVSTPKRTRAASVESLAEVLREALEMNRNGAHAVARHAGE